MCSLNISYIFLCCKIDSGCDHPSSNQTQEPMHSINQLIYPTNTFTFAIPAVPPNPHPRKNIFYPVLNFQFDFHASHRTHLSAAGRPKYETASEHSRQRPVVVADHFFTFTPHQDWLTDNPQLQEWPPFSWQIAAGSHHPPSEITSHAILFL